MKLSIKAILLVSIANLAGCGDTTPNPPETPQSNSQTAPDQALNKARQVEGILGQGAQQEKQAIDAQTQ